MTHRSLKLLSLVLLVANQAQARSSQPHPLELDISDEHRRASYQVQFTAGLIDPDALGLKGNVLLKFERYYSQCMQLKDARYCDANTGSCENGTCGKGNRLCKPKLSEDRSTPVAGYECAAYALQHLED